MKQILTPSKMRAARALAARSVKEISKLSGVEVSTLLDFECGLQPSLGERNEAVERALETVGVRIEEDGSVSLTEPAPQPSSTAGAPHRWITAQDLVAWGATRDGQAHLSELVGRLILATVGPGAKLRFPAGDSVQFAGWDGVCTAAIGAGHVPTGVSVWEFTVQRTGIGGKASRDLGKRSKGPTGVDRADTTFLFVTLQRMPNKDVWTKGERAQGVWKDVVAIDSDELVHWIDLCPGVAEWLAKRVGKRPGGLRTIGDAFDEWSLATAPPLSADLLTADRDEEATAVLRWLNGPPAVFSMQAETPGEAIAFPFAAIGPLPILHRIYWESRMLVAGTETAARSLLGLSSKLVVIMQCGDPGLAASLVNDGHHVYLASETDQPGGVRLSRPWRFTIQRALEAMGLDHSKAQTTARNCGRSLTILRRLMPVGGSKPPAWASAPASKSLLAAMLAGCWDSHYPVDRAILERLAGRSYAELEADLAPFTVALDGPMRKSGTVWKLASLRDAWFLLAGYLTSDLIDRLCNAFAEVMSEDDPAFDADPDDRWKVDFLPPKRASSELRNGLMEAITALAVFPERAANVHDARFRSERAVGLLLGEADERRWWSVSNDFRRLAEASPQAFLDALEGALEKHPSPVKVLFRIDEGFITPEEYLADLLWALEILAWSPEYLDRVSFILCKLVDMDAGRQHGNRPDATLRRIYLPWMPQTFATAARRMDVIDAMLEMHTDPAWALLLALAPEMFSSTDPSAYPAWRDFSGGGNPPSLTGTELYENYRAIGQRLLAAAGSNAGRWAVLLDDWQSFDPQWRQDAERSLTCAIENFGERERDEMRERLRQIVGKHEQSPQADWTLKEEALEPLRILLRQLEPSDPIERNAWLFGGPTFNYRDGRPWEEIQSELEAARRDAAVEILAAVSIEAVMAMAERIRLPRTLGEAIATSTVSEAQKDAFLERALTEDKPALLDLCFGMLIPMRVHRGEDWLARRLADGIAKKEAVEGLVRLALALPAGPKLWTTIADAGRNLDDTYWKRINDHQIPETAEPGFVIGKLLSVYRGPSALTWVAAHTAIAVPAELVVAILRHTSTISGDDRIIGGATMWQYYAVELFKRLDADPTASAQEIAGLEWTYYRLLEHSDRPAHKLNKAIADDPKFFMFLMSKFYLPEGATPPAVSEEDRGVAKLAYHVLSNWDLLPGEEAGAIDAMALEAWIDEARLLGKEAGLAAAVERRIGGILAKAKRQVGAPWPPMAVRTVIEKSKSKALEDAFVTALRNGRGVTVRRLNDGGELEREEAAIYRADAAASGARHARTRALLNKIADGYEHDASWEDRSAEQRDWR